MPAVRLAFAQGKTLPPASHEDKDQKKVYELAKRVNSGCKLPCDTAEEVEKYKKSVTLAAKTLHLVHDEKVLALFGFKAEDEGRDGVQLAPRVAQKVIEVYCKAGEPGKPDDCRKRGQNPAGAQTGVAQGGDEELAKRGQEAVDAAGGQADALGGEKTDDLAAGADGGVAAGFVSKLDLTNEEIVAGKLPEIEKLLAEAGPLLALIGKPLMTITPDEWDRIKVEIPKLQAILNTLEILFESHADARMKALERDSSKKARAFKKAYKELKEKKQALEKNAAALHLEEKLAKIPELKEGSAKVSAGLAEYAKSGRMDLLTAAVQDLDAFFDNAGLKGKEKEKAVENFLKLVESGAIKVAAPGQGGQAQLAYTPKGQTPPAPVVADPAAPAPAAPAPAVPSVLPQRSEADTQENRLAIAGYAAISQLPGIPERAQKDALGEYFKRMHGVIVERLANATLTFLQLWAGKEPKFTKLAEALQKHHAKLAKILALTNEKEREKKYRAWLLEERSLLRSADWEIEKFFKKHPEAKEETDPALVESLSGYLTARIVAGDFFKAWLNSGTASEDARFYESEVTPFQDTKLSYSKVETLRKKRGVRQYFEGKNEDSLFISDDGALVQATGRVTDKVKRTAKSMGLNGDYTDFWYTETQTIKGKQILSRELSLMSSGGKPWEELIMTFSAGGAVLSRKHIDHIDALVTTHDFAKKTFSVENKDPRASEPWTKKEGRIDGDTLVLEKIWRKKIEWRVAGEKLVYEPIPGLRGIPGPELEVDVFDIDPETINSVRRAALMEVTRKYAKVIAETQAWNWDEQRVGALAGWMHERGEDRNLTSVMVDRSGSALMAETSTRFVGQFVPSRNRAGFKEAMLDQYQIASNNGKTWAKASGNAVGSLQNEFYGDYELHRVMDAIGDVDADSDGTLNEMNGKIALMIYRYEKGTKHTERGSVKAGAGEWGVVEVTEKGTYSIYKRQSRWARAAKAVADIPVLKQVLEVGKSAVNGIEGVIMFAGAGIAEVAGDHEYSMHLRGSAWSSWGDVGVSNPFGSGTTASKNSARELSEEAFRKSMSEEDWDLQMKDQHKKLVGWKGSDKEYDLKYGTSYKQKEVKDAWLDSKSADNAAQYYFDRCDGNSAGGAAMCAVGVFTAVGKAFLEMPVMVGGMASLELKLSAWAAKGARALGAGAELASGVYTTTRYGINVFNIGQMAIPVAADAIQAVDACRKGKDDCKQHLLALAVAAGNLGAFGFVYGKGMREFNIKFGAGDAKWLADTALTDAKAGKLKLEPASIKVLELISAGKAPKDFGMTGKYQDQPQLFVADVALGKLDIVDIGGGKFKAVKQDGVVKGETDSGEAVDGQGAKPKEEPGVIVDPIVEIGQPVGEVALRKPVEAANKLLEEGRYSEAIEAYGKYLDALDGDGGNAAVARNIEIAKNNLDVAVRRKLGLGTADPVLYFGAMDVAEAQKSGVKGCVPPACVQGGEGLYVSETAAHAMESAGIGVNAANGKNPGVVVVDAKGLKIVEVDGDFVRQTAEASVRQRLAAIKKKAPNEPPVSEAWIEEAIQKEMTGVIDFHYNYPKVIRITGRSGQRVIVRDPAVLTGAKAYEARRFESLGDAAGDAATFPKPRGEARKVKVKTPDPDPAPDQSGGKPKDDAKPTEAEPTRDGDGGHGEHGSVEEGNRQKSEWEYYRVDEKTGRATPIVDGNIDLVAGQVLGRRHKTKNHIEVDTANPKIQRKAEADIKAKSDRRREERRQQERRDQKNREGDPLKTPEPDPAVEAMRKDLAKKRADAEQAAKNDSSKRAEAEKARKAEEQANFMMDHDLMTGTHNRDWVDANAPKKIAAVRAAGGQPVVAIGDLNGFGPINKGLAKAEGDVLKGTALADKALQKAGVRLSALADSHGVEIGRYGGEEFVVVGDKAAVAKFLQAVKQEFSNGQLFRDAGFTDAHIKAIYEAQEASGRKGQPIGDFTFGLSDVPADGNFPATLKRADGALNYAKQNNLRGEAVANDGGTYSKVDPAMTVGDRVTHIVTKIKRDIEVSRDSTTVAEHVETLRKNMSEADFESFMNTAFRDSTTGMRTFDYIAARQAQWATKYAGGGKAAMLSPSGLKVVNDALGHAAGDRFLKRYGEIVVEAATGGKVEDPVRMGGKDGILVGAQADTVARAAQKAVEAELSAESGSFFSADEKAKIADWSKGEVKRRLETLGRKPTDAETLSVTKAVAAEVGAVGKVLKVERGIKTGGSPKQADIQGTVSELIGDMEAAKKKAGEVPGDTGDGGGGQGGGKGGGDPPPSKPLPVGDEYKAVSSKEDPVGGGRMLSAEGPVGRGRFEGDLGGVVKQFPRLAKLLDITVEPLGNGRQRVTYPDISGLNTRLAKMRGVSVEKLPFKLVEYAGADGLGGEAPTKIYLEYISRGELPISASGKHHFHDLAVHLAGWAALPNRLARFMQAEGRRLLAMDADPYLAKDHALWATVTETLIKDYVDTLDVVTGTLMDEGGTVSIKVSLVTRSRVGVRLADDSLARQGMNVDYARKKYAVGDVHSEIDAFTAQIEGYAKNWKRTD